MDKSLLTLLISVVFIACQTNSGEEVLEPPRVSIYDYQVWFSDPERKDKRDSLVTYLDTVDFKGRKEIGYFPVYDTVSSPLYPYFVESDSLFHFDLYCPFIDSIHIVYKDRIIGLSRSLYDIENSVDEESYIYWSMDYGLMAIYNCPWGDLTLFEREDMPGFAQAELYDYIINNNRF